MAFGVSGGKRLREAARDQKKKDKAERIQRNRAQRAQGSGSSSELFVAAEKLPEVKLEDINISGVAPRGPKGSYGPTKLFVGGLSWDTDNAQLREAFVRFGPLQEAAIVTDRATGRSRGFGFVTFEKPIDAAAAIKQMNGADLDGRTLRVNAADRG